MNKQEIMHLLNDTRQEFVHLRTNGQVKLPFIPGSQMSVQFDPSNISINEVADAVGAISARRIGRQKEAEKALFRSCMQSFEDCEEDFETPQKQLDWEAEQTAAFDAPKVPKRRRDIWKLVRFTTIQVEISTDPAPLSGTIVSLFAECAWDGEHGVALHYTSGKRLIKAG
ncbi:hypothetical protein XMM379_000297 [Aliiroseovarius sp. xm-m-379]|uniref:DUF6985 domain-containing protein n=1 Tax=unclassified Aliiroseovarius TaxID=2623558 RepID=UPI001569D27B|nr:MULTISPECIES: hypothetical protein [unclassified Aliiroseovarius]NRP14141.1 hypothetical protein [Aliiroseovarius sp. xm-d-517]NRP23625.1 hypothetical protein [Aliiroseovarius sp. xm-m-379]NRP29128.1 hypothetical protein [Aliiroseovarius sp. xm-m-314]NRP32424.1 hypothetical protein [Aliiroseovarius sp. xm-a-104]NRP40957.1 hypothetical protein [Aliiroseovarius sp. xm-m-339-2]